MPTLFWGLLTIIIVEYTPKPYSIYEGPYSVQELPDGICASRRQPCGGFAWLETPLQIGSAMARWLPWQEVPVRQEATTETHANLTLECFRNPVPQLFADATPPFCPENSVASSRMELGSPGSWSEAGPHSTACLCLDHGHEVERSGLTSISRTI